MRILRTAWRFLHKHRRIALTAVAAFAVAGGILHVVEQNAQQAAENRQVQQSLDAKQAADWADYQKQKLDAALAARQTLKAEHEVEVRQAYPVLPAQDRKPRRLEEFKVQGAERMGSGLFPD
jgi:hypothetical protein